MTNADPDWFDWHAGYRPDSGSHLVRRLAVVQTLLARELDRRPTGTIRIASLCAGQGDDLLGVLTDHPRRADVVALLVESDRRNVSVTNERAGRLGLDDVVAVARDAGNTSALADVVPVDVLLLCGMLGNITIEHAERTIAEIPRLVAPGASIIWTRRNVPVDMTARIRRAFADAGCEQVDFVNPTDDKFTVGVERFGGDPQPFAPDRHLFDFVGFRTLIARGE